MSWWSGVRLVKAVPRPWPDWVRIAAEPVWLRSRSRKVPSFRWPLSTGIDDGAARRDGLRTRCFERGRQAARNAEKMTVLALGPGLGTEDAAIRLVKRLYMEAICSGRGGCRRFERPGRRPARKRRQIRILTPHPGEMSRLTGNPKRSPGRPLGDRAGVCAQSGATIVSKATAPSLRFPTAKPGSIRPARPPWRPAARATF